MTRALLVFALGFGLIGAPKQQREFNEDGYYRLMKKLDRFHREYIGCSPTGFPPLTDCNNPPIFDVKLWKEIADDSPKVFIK